MVNLWAANTDLDWFDYLTSQPAIDEVNFWQPSGNTRFNAIQPGELFLFKLKHPRNVIGGYGVLSQSSNLPLSLAWEAFGTKNGTRTYAEMRSRIFNYRRNSAGLNDPVIGCRIVVQPIFFPQHLWIPQPESWAKSIVVGKTYDTQTAEGLRLWDRIMAATEQLSAGSTSASGIAETQTPFAGLGARFGAPTLFTPRLGQGAFRLAVTDAYHRECAISGGRVLPALDAAHIQSYGKGGGHEISNGLLLRKDIHCVFDAGYLTFDDDYRMVVSDRVRTDFNNGNEYRKLHGSQLRAPASPDALPSLTRLNWHQENVFLG